MDARIALARKTRSGEAPSRPPAGIAVGGDRGYGLAMNIDPFADPLQFLTACHGRIRQRLFSFRQAADQLRTHREIERHHLEAALLFFRTSGEGHTVDEERSLFPRLRARLAALGETEGAARIDELLADHREHDRLFAEMEAAMNQVDASLGTGNGLPDPDAAPIACGTPAALALADALEALVEAYESHIPIEDDQIYPLAYRVMPREELDEIAGEMRSRRRLGRRLIGL